MTSTFFSLIASDMAMLVGSLVFCNPTQVQLICSDPRYKLMPPEEVIGKFVIFELMIKGSKQIVEQGGTSMAYTPWGAA